MLSFQWFPIKEHMFWLFSIFQLVFHLASIGFFMFFFPFFARRCWSSAHIWPRSLLPRECRSGSPWYRISMRNSCDLDDGRSGCVETGVPCFYKEPRWFRVFFFERGKTPKRGPWNGYLCFSIFRNRVFRQDQWWSSKKWRFGRFFAFLVGRWDGRTANHDHGDIWGLAACPNLDC